MIGTIVGFLLPLAVGVLAAARSWFVDPVAALDALNRYALAVAFPALVVAGLATGSLPVGLAGWLLVPVTVGLALLPLPLVRRLGVQPGTVGLVVVFGNVAYLGLPVVEALLGAEAMDTAALLVGLHVALSMTVGPWLVAADAPEGRAVVLGRLLRQPLLWSPFVGLALRALPSEVGQAAAALLGPLGRSAGPVALFLLGLYLHGERRRLARMDVAAWVHVLAKGVWAPTVTGLCLVVLVGGGQIDLETARVAWLLSAMPPAVTTFSIARELGADDARVAQAIVAGTLLSGLVVPLVFLASALLEVPP